MQSCFQLSHHSTKKHSETVTWLHRQVHFRNYGYIDQEILENIDKDNDQEILENIDIDKILKRLEFGISNRALTSAEDPPPGVPARARVLKC